MGGARRELESNAQLDLRLEAGAGRAASDKTAGSDEARFLLGAEAEFFVGPQRLDQYLSAQQMGWVVRLKALLAELNWESFSCRYKESGWHALHPRVVLGLIIYGILRRQWSLRELEQLARVDLGALWITGRLQPDHSTIGKFIQLHEAVLSGEFFTALVKYLIGKLHLSVGTVATDGTVIEAAASHYQMLKAEALRELKLSKESERILHERERARKEKGKDEAATRLVAAEPEAVAQPTKAGPLRSSYKPSAMRHASGLVIAQAVHASSETAVMSELLSQHRAVFAAEPGRLLADAGNSSIELLRELSARNIDVLIPAGRVRARAPWKKQRRRARHLLKHEFRYDAERDLYHCPGPRTLTRQWRAHDKGRECASYRGRECGGCALRAKCTSAPGGRTLKRYQGEEYKEAMAEVLKQPAARRQLRRRSGIIEPLFAELRERQRLTRFHRRGLKKVAVEFALHCAAFNLKLALGRHRIALIGLFFRFPGAAWQLLAYACLSAPTPR